MKINRIGSIFLVSVLALAGIGISYAGFTDYVQVYGSVNTGTVDLTLVDYSGTNVWKVYTDQPDVEVPIDEIYIDHNWNNLLLTQAEIQALYPGAIVEPIAYAHAMPCTVDNYNEVDIIYDNLFPCIEFIGDFVVKYEGSIPAQVQEVSIVDGYSGSSGVDFTDYISYRYFEISEGADGGWEKGNEITDLMGYQLHNGEYLYVEVVIHLEQINELQGLSGYFTGKIEVIQWNEGPNPTA